MGELTYWQASHAVFPTVRNIFCVGRNFRDHASELGNAVPEQPMIFGKFTHALTAAAGVVTLPAGREEVHHELEIVLYIDKPVYATSRAADVVGAVALGLDLTDRAAQSRLKEKGHPWEFAKSFIGSAIVTDFYKFDTFTDVETSTFTLQRNHQTVQEGHPEDMVFNFDTLVAYCHRHFGLQEGDLLFTGTPAGVGPIHTGDTLAMSWNGSQIGSFEVTASKAEEGHLV